MNEEHPLNQFFESLATAVGAMVETFEAVAVSFAENVAIPICNAMQEAYKEAGSPFGDSQEGLLMWMEVMSLASRREQEREARQIRHELMLDAVRLGEEIRRDNKS